MSSSVLADAATLSFDALAKLDIKEAIVAPKSVAANALVDSIVSALFASTNQAGELKIL